MASTRSREPGRRSRSRKPLYVSPLLLQQLPLLPRLCPARTPRCWRPDRRWGRKEHRATAPRRRGGRRLAVGGGAGCGGAGGGRHFPPRPRPRRAAPVLLLLLLARGLQLLSAATSRRSSSASSSLAPACPAIRPWPVALVRRQTRPRRRRRRRPGAEKLRSTAFVCASRNPSASGARSSDAATAAPCTGPVPPASSRGRHPAVPAAAPAAATGGLVPDTRERRFQGILAVLRRRRRHPGPRPGEPP